MGVWKKNHHKISEIQSVKEILGGGNLQDFFSDFYIFLSLSRTSNQPQIISKLDFPQDFFVCGFSGGFLSHPTNWFGIQRPGSTRGRDSFEPPSQFQTWGLKVHHNMGSVEEFFLNPKSAISKLAKVKKGRMKRLKRQLKRSHVFFLYPNF